MKTWFILLIAFMTVYVPVGSQVKIGFNTDNAEGELVQTDPMAGRQHYKAYSFTLKKGEGIVFTMKSEAFEPHIVLATSNSEIFQQSNPRGNKNEAKLVYIAPADTTFYVIFTSAEDNKTGKFTMHHKTLGAAQMKFNENFSLCDRFSFLINHWQLQWELMPGKVSNTSEDLYKKWWPNLYFNTSNTVQKGGEAEVRTFYTETLFKKENDQGAEAEKYYEQITKTLMACLDTTKWIVEKEPAKPYWLDPHITTAHTYIIIKGGEKDGKQQRIDIMLTIPTQKEPGRISKVQLFFE